MFKGVRNQGTGTAGEVEGAGMAVRADLGLVFVSLGVGKEEPPAEQRTTILRSEISLDSQRASAVRKAICGIGGVLGRRPSGRAVGVGEKSVHLHKNHRTHPRMRPFFPVYVEYPERRSVRDISLSGAFIEDKRAVVLGQRCQFRFWLGNVEPVVINGAIRRVEEGGGLGVEFLSMTRADYDHLREFVHSGVPS